MTVSVAKWGNSLAIRIPQAIAAQAHIEEGTAIGFSIVDGNIILTPGKRKKYSLDELLDGMTEENLHSEVKTGCAVGHEIW